MDAAKFLQVQQQARHNQDDLQTYLLDLENWQDDMKVKDEKLKATDLSEEKTLPPVRNCLVKKCRKKKVKVKVKVKDPPESITSQTNGDSAKRISGYDYRSWDKFDVDKACEDLEGKKEEGGTSDEYETDEEGEKKKKEELADIEKRLGNDLFKKGNYDEAIESYTRAIRCAPHDHLLPANRAMALLKQNKFAAAEIDCTRSISLDPTYIKAYFRRGQARINTDKLLDAKHDFDHVIMFEAGNKAAMKALEKIDTILNPKPESQSLSNSVEGLVKPITKPPHKRSQKSLRRVPIEEIGDEPTATRTRPSSSLNTEHSSALNTESTSKRSVMAEEEKNFARMLQGEAKEHELKHHIRKPPGFERKQELDERVKPIEITELPSKPTGPFQFKNDWMKLSSKFDLLAEYVKQIDPTNYKRLMAEELSADILGDLLLILQRYYMEENLDVFDEMLNLSKVNRFSMNFMFLSATERSGVDVLLAYLRGKGEHSDSDIAALSKLYS